MDEESIDATLTTSCVKQFLWRKVMRSPSTRAERASELTDIKQSTPSSDVFQVSRRHAGSSIDSATRQTGDANLSAHRFNILGVKIRSHKSPKLFCPYAVISKPSEYRHRLPIPQNGWSISIPFCDRKSSETAKTNCISLAIPLLLSARPHRRQEI